MAAPRSKKRTPAPSSSRDPNLAVPEEPDANRPGPDPGPGLQGIPSSLDPISHLPRNVVVQVADATGARTAFKNLVTARAFLTNLDASLDSVLPHEPGLFLFQPDDPLPLPPTFDKLFAYLAFPMPNLQAAIDLSTALGAHVSDHSGERAILSTYVQGYFGSASGPLPSFEREIGRQDYLLPARYGGVDAFHAWSEDACGEGELIYVFESDCWIEHDDFIVDPNTAERSVSLVSGPSPDPNLLHCRQHGTATLGILVATRNTLGVRKGIAGIAHKAKARVALASPGLWTGSTQFANMIAEIYNEAQDSPGIVVLIEHCHMPAGTNIWLPMETDPAFRDFVLVLMEAVGTGGAGGCGAVVIQPAGNSNEDIDTHLLDPTGSIIVGAAENRTPHSRTLLSNYSSSGKVQLFSWGEGVYTTSVALPSWQSDPVQAWEYRRAYTYMSETSAAAAIVAGVATVVQAYRKKSGSDPLNSKDMLKELRKGATTGPDEAMIGVQPNLKSILP